MDGGDILSIPCACSIPAEDLPAPEDAEGIEYLSTSRRGSNAATGSCPGPFLPSNHLLVWGICLMWPSLGTHRSHMQNQEVQRKSTLQLGENKVSWQFWQIGGPVSQGPTGMGR